MAKKNRVRPSRIKYDENHPVVSARLPMDVYRQLKDFQKDSGTSVADVIKAGLGVLEPSFNFFKAAYEPQLIQDFDDVRKATEKLYKIEIPCPVCGKPYVFEGEGRLNLARRSLIQKGFHHPNCRE